MLTNVNVRMITFDNIFRLTPSHKTTRHGYFTTR